MITVLRQNCVDGDCHAAFVATRGYGLYYTDTLVYNDDSDPNWEYVGYTSGGSPLGILQFAWDKTNPLIRQVCLDHNHQGYVRTEYTGTWLKVLDAAIVRTTLTAYGYPIIDNKDRLLSVRLGWIDCWPNTTIYCTVSLVAIGIFPSTHYFFKSTDNGATWRPTAVLFSKNTRDFYPGGISIQGNNHVGYSAGQVIFVTVFNRTSRLAMTGQAGFVVSRDAGESWEPVNEDGDVKPFWLNRRDNLQRPIASDINISACYGRETRGSPYLTYKCLGIDNWCTGRTSKDPGNDRTGWGLNGAVDLSGNSLYMGASNDIFYTHTIESVSPTWTEAPNVTFRTISALHFDTSYGLFVGITNLYAGNTNPHIVLTTAEPFDVRYFKGGSDPSNSSRDSGSIYGGAAGGGVARDGVVTWDVEDEVIEPPDIEPSGVGWSGWPIWINAQARELRADPSWDRLYVMTETVWPDGSGLWNQPILFQFVLSGYVGASFLENEGRLAFIPTFAQGQISVYSGHINYTGLLEAHVNAPLAHGVVVVGKFAVDDQVRYTDDITLATGVLLQMWDIVGAFGEPRVTSVDSEIVIENDVTITYADTLDQPVDTDPTPWDWSSLNDLPFDVNCQYRDSYLWVGAEKAGIAQPIRRTLLVSGSAWQERGGGLPEVPITDIDGGS